MTWVSFESIFWVLWMVVMAWCLIAFFGRNHQKAFSKVPCNQGIFDNIFVWENCEISKSHVELFFAFNYIITLFGIMCPTSPCSAGFSTFYEHFCRFLKFLTLTFQKVFPNYLMFAYVWHHNDDALRWSCHMYHVKVLKICFQMIPILYYYQKGNGTWCHQCHVMKVLKNSFLMIPISYFIKKGNVHTCTNTHVQTHMYRHLHLLL